ncbi:MAG: hypothetical protein KGI08_10540, partial [Thaumarchaeota archaeon]|nr:hypothetical protein [Nitrososphaerota archaeon]
MEIALKVHPKGYSGMLQAGDIYYAGYLKDWKICLPIPDPVAYMPFVEFALNTCASTCSHAEKPNPHRCWEVTGDKELENGDASKLTIRPSILIEYNPNKTIHGFVT